jgi:hypothetical protein
MIEQGKKIANRKLIHHIAQICEVPLEDISKNL